MISHRVPFVKRFFQISFSGNSPKPLGLKASRCFFICLPLSQRTLTSYHISFALSSTFFEVFEFSYSTLSIEAPLAECSDNISNPGPKVNPFFQLFSQHIDSPPLISETFFTPFSFFCDRNKSQLFTHIIIYLRADIFL